MVFQPGDPSVLKNTSNETLLLASTFAPARKSTLLDNFLDLGRNIVPNNLFTAFFEQASTTVNVVEGTLVRTIGTRPGTNTLGIIAISIVFGSIMGTMREEGAPIIKAAQALETLINKTVKGIIWATPVGVASIICAKILEVTDMWTIMSQLALFVVTVAVGLFTYQWIFMQLIYFAIIRKNPFKFLMGVFPAALTGFSTDSSAAALPVTLRCLDENVKINPRVSHFVVPIGIIVNMDGTALFVTVASIFIAQMNSIYLGFGDYATIIITATTVSIATASAPSASLTMMFIVLNAINAPVKDIGLLFAIDWFVDRLRTTNNVLGDCYAAAVVDHYTKNELDIEESKPDGCESPQDGKEFEMGKL
ncbi:unnamed protein product [Allacma fusca]|uniref:Amino acid transporter n=1 Tax=Allacma fusca TaxID=39272 RepID=A0A8J2JU76_9HEXA|nr:unnamed protein product [Allacma fusca]